MSTGHAHALFIHGHGILHRTAPHLKLVTMIALVFAVVATPRNAFWAFGVYAVIVAVLVALAGLRPKQFAARLLIEVPFVIFAVLLPFLGGGERVEVLGIAVSREGLWGAWTILAKGTLGLSFSIILASTTTVPDILSGLDRIRVPRVITAIAGFMIRYLDVVVSEFRRRRIAMSSRGYEPQWIGDVKPWAASAGSMFVRSYERGERVYQAMVARGYTGVMPRIQATAAWATPWPGALSVIATAWATAATAMVLT